MVVNLIRNTIAIFVMLCLILSIIAVTIIGLPIAFIYFLGCCPFATIRWAFNRDETWLESWKHVASL